MSNDESKELVTTIQWRRHADNLPRSGIRKPFPDTYAVENDVNVVDGVNAVHDHDVKVVNDVNVVDDVNIVDNATVVATVDAVNDVNIHQLKLKLKPIPASGQQTELMEAERQECIQRHMNLLFHAAICTSPKCPSFNCTKMKGLLKHGAQCQQKPKGGCKVCIRIWALLQVHARQCKATSCPVPNCRAIRERLRQLKEEQQAVDNRRRQDLNQVY